VPKPNQANDLTTVQGAELFDRCPDSVTTARDGARWARFRTRYHRAQRLETTGDYPPQLDIGLHARCNYRCRFCSHSYYREYPHRMSQATFERIIAEAEAHDLVSIKMSHDCEPLFLPGFPDYVRYAKAHGILNVYIATNGSLLDEDMALDLIEAGVTKIMVSLDAASPQTYNQMRNSDRYVDVVRNVTRLIEIRNGLGKREPLVRVNFLKTKVNIGEVAEFRRLWSGAADFIGFQDQVGIPGVANDWATGSTSFREKMAAFRCSFPFKQIVIAADGTLKPCCPFSGRLHALGNIETMTVAEAWTSKPMEALREAHRSGRGRENHVCAHCLGGEE
jgi:radical SAM protein with 4Fe4S-binding SPASM domain